MNNLRQLLYLHFIDVLLIQIPMKDILCLLTETVMYFGLLQLMTVFH
jgi:hypothetical protein